MSKKQFNLGRTLDRTDVPDTPELERVQRYKLRYEVEHLHGPTQIEYAKDELIVLCLMRNGSHYVRSFVDHYLSLGAKHIVFLDNGSTDGTVEALTEYEDHVTVLRTNLPYNRYMILMKRYLIERFGRGRWSLSVDIDELFDYPYSEVVDLKTFLSYLNEHSYTAVVAHMIDMFPEEPLSEISREEDLFFKENNRFYELTHIIAHDYSDVGEVGNVISNEKIKFYQNGVNQRIFRIGPLLSKHPLIFLDEEIKPMDLSDHWATNARVADLTGVLLHYKLMGSLYRLVHREVQERRYLNRHGKYDKYLQVLKENPELQIKSESSLELQSVNDLVVNGFLTISQSYMALVQKESPGKLMEAFLDAHSKLEMQNIGGNLKEKLRRNRLHRKLKDARQLAEQSQSYAEDQQRRANSLEKQLQAVTSSKSWRLADSINRWRKKLLDGFSN